MGDSSAANDHLGESPAVELTGKIMIVVIIIMFFVIVIALCLHLFARNFWWRSPAPQSRSHRRRRFVFSSGPDGGSGLDPAVLSSLPVLVFEGHAQEFKDGLECAVCLSEVVEGEKARLLPKCNHGFHVACIDMWFQSHSTCPLCRNPVASSEESSESPTFPTNVLVWGNQAQISSTGGGGASLEEGSSSSSSASTCDDHGMLVIDIPSEMTSTSLSPEDDVKSPMTGRLRSLKRLLSRDKRFNPSSPTSSPDVQQPGSGS
ncbi:hypothetical protein AAZX31_03G241900 [Glycine max]|uniref:RING-type E3 ubiquitin transferase n=3 Tax=Glycine subgen. Soja TaxID=1462606 RepID=A0A0R4J308_SOYBN|nr:RING-H2 finger protein ATL3 [Glycine max]XP_028226936.1 RING-H2 finger protein ATL3-like [Glycine soja]KAG5044544.1 hypothetical protein JHK87_008459 [Glycine soja]KAG5056336.1 hypothetical protein JHK85_008846 [Glycine max]KAG5073400.1 hypothetical protein JHK86_008611 [Glycine max]KAH1071959.1 hypothetical protein GYH30_008434 [Glycine max]KAH1259649.1 RING-H2 finger protein ATL3 [Glycine max]|eukprot:XP_003521836.1 RING-H2 finger protein ATL3 [Glycine max]